MGRMLSRLRRFHRSERGASAAEFAIVAPVFIFLVLAIINLSMLAYSATDLHFAAQRGARCIAMSNGGVTVSSATCLANATSSYTGPAIGAAFAASTAGCGNTVTGSGTFPVRTGLVTLDVPLSAAACYPLQ